MFQVRAVNTTCRGSAPRITRISWGSVKNARTGDTYVASLQLEYEGGVTTPVRGGKVLDSSQGLNVGEFVETIGLVEDGVYVLAIVFQTSKGRRLVAKHKDYDLATTDYITWDAT